MNGLNENEVRELELKLNEILLTTIRCQEAIAEIRRLVILGSEGGAVVPVPIAGSGSPITTTSTLECTTCG
jgi:hypothetical protein